LDCRQSKNGQDGPRNKYFRTPRRRKLPDSVSFSRQKLDEDEPSVQVASSSANVDLFIDPTVMVSSDGIISSTITEKNEACSSSNDNAMLTDVEQADSFHKEESGGSMLMEGSSH
jgi:hypothetical protein